MVKLSLVKSALLYVNATVVSRRMRTKTITYLVCHLWIRNPYLSERNFKMYSRIIYHACMHCKPDFVKKVGRNGSIPVLHTHRVRIMYHVEDKILRKIGKHKKNVLCNNFNYFMPFKSFVSAKLKYSIERFTFPIIQRM